jgi:Domain of unknown function (DUF4426)
MMSLFLGVSMLRLSELGFSVSAVTESDGSRSEGSIWLHKIWLHKIGLHKLGLAVRAGFALVASLALLVFASAAQAFPQGEIPLGQYQLHYSVVNSTLLPAEMATAYGFKRKADEVVVNITVMDTQAKRAVPVQISGVAKNLIQQSKPLQFREIKETNAVYYLAILRTTEREVFHFLLELTLPDGKVEKATFTQELFVNP